MPDDPIIQQLIDASRGLLYPSESDEPFDVFTWPDDKQSARDQIIAHVGTKKKIEEIDLDSFFSELKDAGNAADFQRLRQILQTLLINVNVFRVGTIRIDIYLIGRTSSGAWAGLHTVSVET